MLFCTNWNNFLVKKGETSGTLPVSQKRSEAKNDHELDFSLLKNEAGKLSRFRPINNWT